MIINLLNWFPWVRWMINKYVWCRWPYRNNRNVLYFVFERVSEWFYWGSSQLFDYDLWDQSMLCIRLRVWSRPRFIDSFDSHYSKLSDIDLQNREYIYILALVSKLFMVIQLDDRASPSYNLNHSCWHQHVSYPVTKGSPHHTPPTSDLDTKTHSI